MKEIIGHITTGENAAGIGVVEFSVGIIYSSIGGNQLAKYKTGTLELADPHDAKRLEDVHDAVYTSIDGKQYRFVIGYITTTGKITLPEIVEI